jgi:hypothetical protein
MRAIFSTETLGSFQTTRRNNPEYYTPFRIMNFGLMVVKEYLSSAHEYLQGLEILFSRALQFTKQELYREVFISMRMLRKVTANKLFWRCSGEERKVLMLKNGIRTTIDLVLNSICRGRQKVKPSAMLKKYEREVT